MCFVLNENSDDPDTSACMVGQNVPLPTEATPPTASAAVDIKNTATVNDRAMDGNGEIWATEADHRTGWKKTFKSGTYRGMGMCDGRSTWTIDCRKFDDPDNDRSLRKHNGRNPRITRITTRCTVAYGMQADTS